MAVMGFCLLVTVIALFCQSIALFLPGWTKLNSGKDEIQMGIWYTCVNWTSCETKIKDLNNAKPGIPIDTTLVIQIVSETIGFIILLISTSMLSFVVCCASTRSSNLINVTIRAIIGLNMAASWTIIIGVLLTDLHYFKNLYSYGIVLAVIASILSMLSTFLACCENKSYKTRRPVITGYIDPPSDMYASNSISKHDYYHSNHQAPYPNYHHGAPYYG